MKSSRRSLFRLLGVGAAGTVLARFLPEAEATVNAPTRCTSVISWSHPTTLRCELTAGHVGVHEGVRITPSPRSIEWGLDGSSLGGGSGPTFDLVRWRS